MSNSVHSVHAPAAQTQTPPTAPPPKNQETSTQKAAPQDKVTISELAKQALAKNAKPAD
jgi:hypothetical protein